MGQQHTQNVPNWHLQLLQVVLVAHADISCQHTLITNHNYSQTLQKKSLPFYNSVLTTPISRSHSHYNGDKQM